MSKLSELLSNVKALFCGKQELEQIPVEVAKGEPTYVVGQCEEVQDNSDCCQDLDSFVLNQSPEFPVQCTIGFNQTVCEQDLLKTYGLVEVKEDEEDPYMSSISAPKAVKKKKSVKKKSAKKPKKSTKKRK